MTDRVGVSEWEYEWVIKPHTYITQTHPHGQTKSAVGVVNVVVNVLQDGARPLGPFGPQENVSNWLKY